MFVYHLYFGKDTAWKLFLKFRNLELLQLRGDMGLKRKPKSHLKLQVKKTKIQNLQNFTMQTIFDRFPTLSDDILEILDEKSLANCVEVNRKWQTTIANQRVYLKKKFKKWTKYCKQSSHSG